MKLSYILCVFVFGAIFSSDFFFLSCVAATSCPVRAVPVSAPEVERGYKCVCMRNYYGTNCRFKARTQSIDADAQWLAENTAKVTWHGQYGENYHLSVRKISYENGTIIPSKWFQAKVTSVNVELYSNTLAWLMFKPGTPANLSAELRLAQAGNYEVYLSKVTSTGDVNGSVSIFLDTFNTLVLDEKNISTNQTNEIVKCAWFECPGQFFHVTNIVEDFGKPCFVHGAIVAVPVTIFGILLIGTLIYIVVRQCKRLKKQKPNTNINTSGTEPSDVQNVGQNDKDNETIKSFVIEMPELDINSYPMTEIHEENESFTGKEDLKSFAVTIEDIQEVKPPSVHWTDEENLSQLSGSSLTTVTSLSTISISSLSEGEVKLSLAQT